MRREQIWLPDGKTVVEEEAAASRTKKGGNGGSREEEEEASVLLKQNEVPRAKKFGLSILFSKRA